MIKINGNLKLAKEELRGNVATAFVYEKSKTNINGKLSDSVITLKDLYATLDAPTQSSSKMLEGFKTGYDATIVKKLKESGTSIVGKVHLDELALGGTGTYSAFGIIPHPLDSERIIGGSSSGSVATLTKNVTASIGSDTGDSIRLPASFNGFVGYKPSYGAISRYGQFAYASSLDVVGVISHNVNDAIVIGATLFGKDELDMTSKEVDRPVSNSVKPKKVAFITNNEDLKDYQIKKYAELKEKFIQEGIEVVEFTLDENLVKNIGIVYKTISYSEASSNDSNLNGISFGNAVEGKDWNEIMINTRTQNFGLLVSRRFTLGAYFLSDHNIKDTFYKAQKVRRLISEEFNRVKKDVDFLVFPSTKIAPKINDNNTSTWYDAYLIHANLSGTPSVTIPWGKEEEMPFGLSMDGMIDKDKKLMSHALYVEELLGGKYE